MPNLCMVCQNRRLVNCFIGHNCLIQNIQDFFFPICINKVKDKTGPDQEKTPGGHFNMIPSYPHTNSYHKDEAVFSSLQQVSLCMEGTFLYWNGAHLICRCRNHDFEMDIYRDNEEDYAEWWSFEWLLLTVLSETGSISSHHSPHWYKADHKNFLCDFFFHLIFLYIYHLCCNSVKLINIIQSIGYWLLVVCAT